MNRWILDRTSTFDHFLIRGKSGITEPSSQGNTHDSRPVDYLLALEKHRTYSSAVVEPEYIEDFWNFFFHDLFEISWGSSNTRGLLIRTAVQISSAGPISTSQLLTFCSNSSSVTLSSTGSKRHNLCLTWLSSDLLVKFKVADWSSRTLLSCFVHAGYNSSRLSSLSPSMPRQGVLRLVLNSSFCQ